MPATRPRQLAILLGGCVALIQTNCLAAPLPKDTRSEPIPSGSSQIEVTSGTNAITVFTYKPRTYKDGPLIVVFHGLLRDAQQYRDFAIPMANRFNAIVVAPLFDSDEFSNEDYSRGGVIKDGVIQPRENWTYLRIPGIIEAVRQREGRPALPYYFIGHSGGGQFLMRMAALYPMEAKRIVAANPGSDFFPRRDWMYPYGFGGLPKDLSDDTALRRYLAAPLTLYLGQGDNDPHHPKLDRTPSAALQGKFRLERGRACFTYAQKLARAHGWIFNWRKVEVPRIAHDGRAMLAAKEVQDAFSAR